MELAAGTRIADQYEIEAPIGEGAMGEVWRAVQLGLGRRVAIKVLRRQFVARDEARARFVREARVAASLDHPGSVAVLDFGEHDGLLYLVMELLIGETLRHRIERGPVPLGDAVTIVRQIASALAAAHRISLVHRDIKPENIFLEAGPDPEDEAQVKVVDFGLAFIAAADEERPQLGRMTDEGVLGGTPAYMSPEQVRGRAIGPASDVYSLGCVFHELIAGRPPFVGSVGEVLTRHAYAPAPSLRALVPGAPCPIEIDELVAAMLSKSPPSRPSPNRIIAMLANFLDEDHQARPGRTPAVLGERAARVLSRPAVDADDDPATLPVLVIGALDAELGVALAAAGLRARVDAEPRAGDLVWAPGASLDRLAALAAAGAAVVTDAATGEVATLAALVRAGVAEVVARPVDGAELARRLRRAHRHHRAGAGTPP